MRLMFAFYILFSVVFDSCHATAEIDHSQTAIESQTNIPYPTISQAHTDCDAKHPSSDSQPNYCHSTHCTFLLDPDIRIVLAAAPRLQTEYFFYEPQSSIGNLRRPPKSQT